MGFLRTVNPDIFMKAFALLLLFSSVLATGAGARPLDEVVDAEADLFLSIRDLSDLREAWQSHPLVRDVFDTPLTEWLDLFRQSEEGSDASSGWDALLEEFNLDEARFFELFGEQAGLVVYNLPELLLQQERLPDMALLANFSGSKEELDALMKIQFDRNAKAQRELNSSMEHTMIEEIFMGETLHFDEAFDGESTYIEDGYAFVDGVFILARPEARLRSLVESIKEGAENPLRGSNFLQRIREGSERPEDLVAFVNFESFLPELEAALENEVPMRGLALFGVSGRSLQAALSLGSLGGFGLLGYVEEDAVSGRTALLYREKSGLPRLLSYGDGPLPTAAYVPESVLASSVTTFDLSEMSRQLEALLALASPSTPALLNIQLEQVKANSGVDLRRALLENFGAEIVSYSLRPEGLTAEAPALESQQVYVFKIIDAAALSAAVEALKDLIPGARSEIQTRLFEGETIHTLALQADPEVPGMPPFNFSFVVTRSHLVACYGQPGLIQSVLSAMQEQEAGFWQSDRVAMLADRFDNRNVVGRSYTDFGEIMDTLLTSFLQATRFSGNDRGIRASDLPELSWYLFTETFEAEDGFFSDMILVREAPE